LNNGVLTISGTGPMRNYSYDDYRAPWYSLRANITTIIINNGVTSIGGYAFQECTGLTSIDIPTSVTSIGSCAFNYCTNLASITIPNSVASIGNSAFSDCSSLVAIEIPDSVTTIESRTFEYCSKLASVRLGCGVKSIHKYAFLYCYKLTSINIPYGITEIDEDLFRSARLKNIEINSDSIISKNYTSSKSLKDYFGVYVESYTFGDSVRSIGEFAFAGSTNLPSITIPNTITSIGQYAFYECTNLTSVFLNSNAVLNGCDPGSQLTDCGLGKIFGSRVREYIIGEDVTSIGYYAFYGCNLLSSVTIPNTVTSIGNCAFYNCYNLTTINIPNSVNRIGTSAFLGCTSLTSVTLPDSITDIGEHAFEGCTSLPVYDNLRYADTYLAGSVNGGYSTYTIKEGTRFIGSKVFDSYATLTSITIPDGVIAIGQQAFQGCQNLSEITLPSSVKYIGNMAFNTCYFNTFTCYAEIPPATGDIVFYNVDLSKRTLYVPAGSVEVYRSTPPWSGFCDNSTGHPHIYPISTLETYTITFLNYDGTELQVLTDVEEGTIPSYTGTTPTRPDDEQYTYSFSGWAPTIVAATADATYTAQFTATELPTPTCGDVHSTWLETGGSGLGSMTTTNSEVWIYNSQYGAVGKKQGGATGWLLTPSKNLLGMQSITLSFSHTHKYATVLEDELTLWACADYQGSVDESSWQQLTISPYATNYNWNYVDVSIDVPLNNVGENTVFGFKYVSTASNYATWEIKDLHLDAECGDLPTTIENISSTNCDSARKLLRDGQILILRGDHTYTLTGQRIE